MTHALFGRAFAAGRSSIGAANLLLFRHGAVFLVPSSAVANSPDLNPRWACGRHQTAVPLTNFSQLYQTARWQLRRSAIDLDNSSLNLPLYFVRRPFGVDPH